MPTTEEHKIRYASNPAGEYILDGLSLSHPGLAAAYHFTNWPDDFTGQHEGSDVLFQHCPFEFKLPDRNASGSQKLRFAIALSGPAVSQAIEDALAISNESVKATLTEYTLGSATQQTDPVVLYVSQLTTTGQVLTGTASSADILNRRFPSKLFTTAKFPGLDR